MCEEEHMCPGNISNNLFPKVGNCKQYYECVNGKAILRQCPNNLEFDITTDTCSPPSADSKCVSCPAVDDPKKNITISSTNSCNQ